MKSSYIFNHNRKGLILLIIVFAFTMTTLTGMAQQAPISNKSTELKVIEGKKYLIHEVLKGQTLYSISQAYSVEVKDIVLENPSTVNGLNVGMELKIPVEGSKEAQEIKHNGTTEKVGYHTVEQGNTLYSISRQYNVSVDELKRLNPASENGIHIGDVLLIPQTSAIHNTVPTPAPAATVVPTPKKQLAEPATLSGKPIEKAKTMKANNIYEIGILLPFYLDKNDSINNNGNPSGEDRIFNPTTSTLEFYEGIKLAVDSLEKQGIHFIVRTYDTRNDENEVSRILAKPEIASLDLLIGPPFNRAFQATQTSSMKKYNLNQVAMYVSDSVLINNPRISKAWADKPKQIEAMADYIFESYGHKNIILIANKNDAMDRTNVAAFKKRFNELNLKHKSTKKYFECEVDASVKTICHESFNQDTNIVVLLSSNQAFVGNVFTRLNSLCVHEKNGPKAILFGLADLKRYNLDAATQVKLALHIPSTTYIDHNEQNVKDFILKFRSVYKTDPSIFAFQGFDLAYFYLIALNHYGKDFSAHLNEQKSDKLLGTEFRFNHKSDKDGFSNDHVYILKCDDYQYKVVNK